MNNKVFTKEERSIIRRFSEVSKVNFEISSFRIYPFLKGRYVFDNEFARFYKEKERGITIISPCEYGKEISIYTRLNFIVDRKRGNVKIILEDIGESKDEYESYCIDKIDIESRDLPILCEFYKINFNGSSFKINF